MNAHLATRTAHRLGMTLIEILVVMSIMIILVSALITGGVTLYHRGQVKGTVGLLEQLAAALEQYKAIHRIYVPIDASTPIDPPETSTYSLWQALTEEKIENIAQKYKKAGDTYTDPRNGAEVRRYYYVDAWNQPIWYECPAPYRSFRLTSGGKDLLIGTAGTPETGDNIIKE